LTIAWGWVSGASWRSLRLRGENAFLLTNFYRQDAKYAKEEQVAHASGSVSVHFRVLPWQLLFFILNIR